MLINSLYQVQCIRVHVSFFWASVEATEFHSIDPFSNLGLKTGKYKTSKLSIVENEELIFRLIPKGLIVLRRNVIIMMVNVIKLESTETPRDTQYSQYSYNKLQIRKQYDV